ncbi:MAG: hypothetical protein JWQ54_37 [Mucilaginibacter sp.]|nr:hypothetical protein [Mucilaginibacter sp.]
MVNIRFYAFIFSLIDFKPSQLRVFSIVFAFNQMIMLI